jgi:hypothetical protein
VNLATFIAILIGCLFFLFVRTWALNSRGSQAAFREIPYALVMFAAAMAGSVGGGWVAFRAGIFRPELPSAQVFTTGALMAGVLCLTRIGKIVPALILSLAWFLYQGGAVMESRDSLSEIAAHLAWCLILVIGVFIITVLWELMMRRGIHLGKCLLAGPLLGGVYLAAAPVTFLGNISPNTVMQSMVLTFFLGIVIGDGVGLGVELVELVRTGMDRRTPEQVGR